MLLPEVLINLFSLGLDLIGQKADEVNSNKSNKLIMRNVALDFMIIEFRLTMQI